MAKFSLLHSILVRLALFWFIVSPLVVLWDAGFLLMRPRSLPGGDLHYIWKPYALYITVDKPYGDMEDTFILAQAWANLVEVILSFATVALLMQNRNSAVFVGFLVSCFTFWKTVIYVIQYHSICNGAHKMAHTTWSEMIFLFLVPGGFWIVFPFIFMLFFGSIIMTALNSPSPSSRAKNKSS